MKKVNMNVAVDNDYEANYLVVTSDDGDLDCIECDTLEEAEEELRQQYSDTMVYMTAEWESDPDGKLLPPTAEQVEEWNEMIDTMSFYIVAWDEDEDEWDTSSAWILEPEELEELGWSKK